MLGHSLDPGLVRERAQGDGRAGVQGPEVVLPLRPERRLEGMERNVALVRTVREAVGPDDRDHVRLLHGLATRPTSIRLLERIAEFRPRWIEEPVPPDRMDDFVAIRRATRVPIATGEHEYTRWGFLQLLQADAVDVIQADPDWCGGISELVKICTLASAFGRQVFRTVTRSTPPFTSSPRSPPATCPMAEYLLRNQPGKQFFHETRYEPVDGAMPCPPHPASASPSTPRLSSRASRCRQCSRSPACRQGCGRE